MSDRVSRSSTRPRHLLAVASHLWASDVHQAAVDPLQLRGSEHVLDVGAGFGPATLAASRLVRTDGVVTAIEPSRVMRVAVHVRRALSRHRRKIRVRAGLAEHLRVPDQSVDAVIALNVVHLLQDQQQAARELARVLKPHGQILFVEEDLEHPDHRFHEPAGHTELHHGLADGIDTMAKALTAARLVATLSHVDRLGGQPAHLITAIPLTTEATSTSLRTKPERSPNSDPHAAVRQQTIQS